MPGNRNYTLEEKRFIADNRNEDAGVIASTLGRLKHAIVNMISRLKHHPDKFWGRSGNIAPVAPFPSSGSNPPASPVPNRSNKAWRAKEKRFLRENYGKMSAEEIAKALGRTREGVRVKAGRLGLCKNVKRRGPYGVVTGVQACAPKGTERNVLVYRSPFGAPTIPEVPPIYSSTDGTGQTPHVGFLRRLWRSIW